jgi:hypothetical protein
MECLSSGCDLIIQLRVIAVLLNYFRQENSKYVLNEKLYLSRKIFTPRHVFPSSSLQIQPSLIFHLKRVTVKIKMRGTQMVKHLPNKREATSSNPSTTKKKKSKKKKNLQKTPETK